MGLLGILTPVIIEEHTESGTAWNVGLRSSNPDAHECIECKNERSAILLVETLNELLKGACKTCGQHSYGQTGEYPCPTCQLPTLHDEPVETCPQCEGDNDRLTLIHMRDGSCRPSFECRFCEDKGYVSPSRAKLWEMGENLRDMRMELGLTMRAAALGYGVTGADWSDMENATGEVTASQTQGAITWVQNALMEKKSANNTEAPR